MAETEVSLNDIPPAETAPPAAPQLSAMTQALQQPQPRLAPHQMVNETQTVVRKTSFLKDQASTANPAFGGVRSNHYEPIEMINAAAEDETKRSTYMLTITRMKPYEHQFPGNPRPTRLIVNYVIEELSPIRWDQIESHLHERHGGGTYRIELLDSQGKRVTHVIKTIPYPLNPPKIPDRAQGQSMSAVSAAAVEPDEVTRQRIEENKINAQISTMKAEENLRIQRKKIEQQQKAEREAEELEAMRPELMALEAKNREQNSNFMTALEKINTQQNSAIEKILTAITATAAKPADDGKFAAILQSMQAGNAQMMQMFQASQQATMQMFTTMMTAMATTAAEANKKKEGPDAVVEMMKLNQQATQAQAEDFKNLFTTILTSTLAKPEDHAKTLMDGMKMQAQLQQQALEIVEARQDNGIQSDDPLTGLLAKGASLVETIIKGRMMQPPPPPPQQRPQIQARVMPQAQRANIQQQKQAATKPPPQSPSAVLPTSRVTAHVQSNAAVGAKPQEIPPAAPPVQVVQPQTAQVSGDSIFIHEHVDVSNVKTLYSIEVPPPPAPPIIPPAVEEVATVVEAVPDAAPPAPVVSPAQVDPKSEAHLKEWVTRAMSEAINDMVADPAEYGWVDTALAKWNGQFIEHIVNINGDSPDSTAALRVEAIHEKCDPKVWDEVSKLFYGSETSAPKYGRFVDSINDFVEARQPTPARG